MSNQRPKHTYLVEGIERITNRYVVYLVRADTDAGPVRVAHDCAKKYGLLFANSKNVTGYESQWRDRLGELAAKSIE